MIPSDPFQPLQLKGEIMDLEFTIDTDHRKRRRNRTTQSCLNCHTSKRKCDRKRPCQRCIQLGLTGLCVYEIDDPALRDDPTIDESTRLRNRIAELESLVRELRGKPHPRWAETNFRDGDPNEKWHSRATKCIPLKRNAQGQAVSSPQGGAGGVGGVVGGGNSSPGRGGLNPVKSEPNQDGSNSHLYRFSPSPAPSMRYHTFQTDVRADSTSSNGGQVGPGGYNHATGLPYANAGAAGGDSPYHNGSATGGGSNGSSTYSDGTPNGNGNGAYNGTASDDGTSNGGVSYGGAGGPGSVGDLHYNCSCRSNPALGLAYLTLSQTIQTSLSSIRQYSNHPSNSQCSIYRRMVELNTLLQPHSSSGSESPGLVPHTYDSGPPSDSEIMTPLSASGSHASFHTGSPGVSPQEWNHMAAAATGFNPYFPAQDHHNVYNVNHVLS